VLIERNLNDELTPAAELLSQDGASPPLIGVPVGVVEHHHARPTRRSRGSQMAVSSATGDVRGGRAANRPTPSSSQSRCSSRCAERRRGAHGGATAGGVAPINSLDGEPVGNGEPGPVIVKIRDRFWALMDEPSPLMEAIDC
jgi:hypothetical protein